LGRGAGRFLRCVGRGRIATPAGTLLVALSRITREIMAKSPRRIAVVQSVAAVGCLVLGLYVLGYLALSVGGCYEPASWGLNGVKSYSWAPQGFVHDLEWNAGPMRTFLPLYYLDTHLWHRDGDYRSGKYPVHWIESDRRSDEPSHEPADSNAPDTVGPGA
jgi:hypothetical protein